jgi:sensor histidine kinase YesM
MNTLHALLGLVRRDPARAETALEKLGDLLKFGQWVHQSGADFVPFSREWDFARSYLDLERIRFGERLGVALEADEAALSVAVPPFALQPLVENAILHGVAPRASGGRIEISARRLDGWLSVTVRDDGPGSSPDAIRASPRMGLRLLQERLTALYAGRARLSYESPEDGGFRVRLEVPDDRAPEVG